MTLSRVAPQNRLRAVLRFLTPPELIAKISLPSRSDDQTDKYSK